MKLTFENPSLSAESQSDFFGNIGQDQDAGGQLPVPKDGGDTAQVGEVDHVKDGDVYMTPERFKLKYVNEEDDEDEKEDEDEGDIDDDDEDESSDESFSEESVREHLHDLYALEAAIREHGLDRATAEFIVANEGLVDLSSLIKEDASLEHYGLEPEINAHELPGAVSRSIQILQNQLRDMQAGIA